MTTPPHPGAGSPVPPEQSSPYGPPPSDYLPPGAVPLSAPYPPPMPAPGTPAPGPVYAQGFGGPVPPAPVPARPVPVNRKGLAILVCFGLGLAVWLFGSVTRFWVEDAKVGDCLARVAENEVRTVSCDAADAKFRVVSIVEDELEPTAASNPCSGVAAADSSYWQGRKGRYGRVLCLVSLS